MTRSDPKATPKPIPRGLDVDTYRLHLAGRTLLNTLLALDREEARARAARQREARRALTRTADDVDHTQRGDT